MKRLFSFSVTSTFTFILSILAILVIAVSAPGMAQAVLGPPASPGDVQPGSAIQGSGVRTPGVNPAGLSDTGIFGTVGIGIASPVSPLHIVSTSSTQPETIDLDGAQPITAQWNDYCGTGGAFSGSGFLGRFARGSKASPSNVQSGDRLGFNVFGGWAGTGFKHTAAIEAIVGTGAISDTSLATYLKFSTTPAGSTTRVEAMRISSSGRVGIGTTSPNSGQLDVETTSGTAAYGYSSTGAGVYGQSLGGEGVHGQCTSGDGVYGGSPSGYGVYGISSTGTGVYGQSDSSNGINGQSTSWNGVLGTSGTGTGVAGGSDSQMGVYGTSSTTTGTGVYGKNSTSLCIGSLGTYYYGVYGKGEPFEAQYAGYFDGNVQIVNGGLDVNGGGVHVHQNLTVDGNLQVYGGTKNFVVPDPSDPTKDIYYACLEGPEAGTYIRGSAELKGGEATIQLPDNFAKVTADSGLSVQLTPAGKWLQLYVAESSTGRIVVKEATGQSGSFYYLVNGVRKGYEDYQVVRDHK